jgi:hypothetical protein
MIVLCSFFGFVSCRHQTWRFNPKEEEREEKKESRVACCPLPASTAEFATFSVCRNIIIVKVKGLSNVHGAHS